LYGELNARANQLARHLRNLGVDTGTLVGIYMERSIEMIVALLAVHKAGGAYLPLDPAFPSDRLAFMVEDSQTRYLISQQRLQDQLPVHRAQVVYIDHDWPQIGVQPASNLEDAVTYDGERLAYVLYTSGSTGRPKGVQVPQRALVNFLVAMQQSPGLAREDILLSVTTLSFDIAGLEIFLPLITGAQIEMVSHVVAADGAALLAVLQGCGATVMQATPATWRLLISAGWEGTPGLKILCGGEAMPGELAGQLLPRCASLWNMYGPTETTIWSTVCQVGKAEGIMPIGRAIANTQVYILDEARQPTPLGVAGELYIGGDGVAHGYLYRPELTAEKFVHDPFVGEVGARMYRTGDLARYRADGNLDFLGRVDFQVKIRGFRIELGEIEALLDEHPSVHQAVVMAREDTPGDLRLVAYLAVAGTEAPAASELRSFLKEKLPDYMVPSVFVTVETFPLTPNGKVNRKALPAPSVARVETSVNHVAPRNDIERKIAAMWQSVLGVEKVGVTDNFFDLGGHSLLIVQVHNQIRRSFDTNVTIAQMFQYPTVEALAAHLQRPQIAAGNLQQAQERALRQRAQFEQAIRGRR
jgi:amino acid adenylation domain-containing protein